MSMPIILLCGVKNSGKSTIANIMAKEFNCAIVALADPIKRFAHQVFDVPNKFLWGPSELRSSNVKIDTQDFLNKIRYSNGLEPAFIEIARSSGREMFFYDKISNMKANLTVRELLQYLGTDIGREYDSNLWINEGWRSAKALLSGGFKYDPTVGLVADNKQKPYEAVVIEDGRMINEIMGVSEIGGKVVKILTDNFSDDNHVSEQEVNLVSDKFFDFTVSNYKNSPVNVTEVKYLYHHLLPDPKGVYDHLF